MFIWLKVDVKIKINFFSKFLKKKKKKKFPIRRKMICWCSKKKLCSSLVEANESLSEAITMGKISSGKKKKFIRKKNKIKNKFIFCCSV